MFRFIGMNNMKSWQQFYRQNELQVWMLLGAVMLTFSASLMHITSRPTFLVPWPLNMGLLKALFPQVVAILLLPCIYSLHLYWTHANKNFGRKLLVKIAFFSMFNFLWIYLFIERELNAHNYWPTVLTALENILMTVLLASLALWGKARNKSWALYAANMGLYFLLSWCAFPDFYDAEQYY